VLQFVPLATALVSIVWTEGILVMNYPNKRAMIQQILEKHGYFDWYIAQPDTQNPDSRDPRCILVNFAEKKRAELVIPYEWFQHYKRIAKLITLAVQHPSPATHRAAARQRKISS
jgi:hypothetical protein